MNPASVIDLLGESLAVAGGATLVALLAGACVALAMAWLPAFARRSCFASGVFVLALPGFLVAGMWMEKVGFAGAWRIGEGTAWLRQLPMILSSLVLGLLYWPVVALLVAGSWEGLDARWLEMHPELQGFALLRRLLWPRARGAMAQAAALVAALSMANFAVPALFQARVWPAEIWVDFSTRFEAGAAFAKSVPPALVVIALLFLAGRRSVAWPTAANTGGARRLRERLGVGWLGVSALGTSVVVLVSAGFPLLQLLGQSRTWTELGPAWAAAAPSAGRSLIYAAVTATIVTGAGALGSGSRWLGLSVVALAYPGIFVGLVLVKAGEWPGLGWLRDSSGVVVLAWVARYLFVGWFVARRSWLGVDPRMKDVLTVQGGSRWTTWRHAILPSGGTALAAGWFVVYLLGLWDVETTILIVPPGGDPLAMMIFNLLHYGHNSQVSALCLLLAALALLPWVAWNLGRRIVLARVRPAGVASAMVLLGVCGGGCGSSETERVARLDSKLFERVEVIGMKGTGPGQFLKPRSVALDGDELLYAVDMTGRVQKFGVDGRWLLHWQMPETTKGKAKGMVTAPDGGLLLVEPHYHRVNHFTPDGRLLGQWGVHGTNDGQFWFPRAIALGTSNVCWVAEYGVVERVQRFQADGSRWLDSLGTPGTGTSQFNRAEGIGVDREGRLYVADSCNHRIQVFDREGRFLRAHGRAGRGVGEFSYPYDVRVDAEGRQYVCEFGNSRVQIFDARDHPLEMLGGAGSGPDRMNNPWSLCLDSRGNLYVADSLNHRVLKFVRRGRVAPAASVASPSAVGGAVSPRS